MSVLREGHWLTWATVQENATLNLFRARANGDASYDPASAITVYYNQVCPPHPLSHPSSPRMLTAPPRAQARNEVAAANYILPLTTALLQSTTAAFATYAAQRYLAYINPASNGTSAANATALRMLADAPQTLAPAVAWTVVNLRPYT